MSLRIRIDDNCTEEERNHAISVIKSYALPDYKLIACYITRKICKHPECACSKCAIARKNGFPIRK